MCKNVPDDDLTHEVKAVKRNATFAWWFMGVFFIILMVAPMTAAWFRKDVGPWYLGCIHRDGEELLLKTEHKPRVEGSLVYIGDDAFVTPEPGMSCRIVRAEEIDKMREGLDNPN
jgi:hypothetical protein